MIVNCLPLYEPPPMGKEETNSGSLRHNVKISIGEDPRDINKMQESLTDEPTERSFSLIKSWSENALNTVTAELELHDNDCIMHRSEESITRTPVSVAPNKWFSASYSTNSSVMVQNSFDNALLVAQADSQDSLLGINRSPRRSVSESDVSRKVMATANEVVSSESGRVASIPIKVKVEVGDGTNGAVVMESGDEALKKQNQITPPLANGIISETPKQEKVANKKKLQTSKSASPTDLEDIGSDDNSDGQHLQVNYLDPPTMSSLRRATGSASFFSKKQETTTTGNSTTEEHRVNGVSPTLQEDDSHSTTTTLATPNSSKFSSQATPPQQHTTILLIPSPLPVPPSTLDPSYIERSGWLNKLSHRRGMFGDKWQRRYFVLHRSWLYYFKKYGVSIIIHMM